jgi:hypothetical protein
MAVYPLDCNKSSTKQLGDLRSLISRISFSKMPSKNCLVSNFYKYSKGLLYHDSLLYKGSEDDMRLKLEVTD